MDTIRRNDLGGFAGERAMFRHVRTGLQLTKARLSLLVVATAAAAYAVARGGTPFHAPCFLWTVMGTGLAAAGANAINQCMGAARDRAMPRTRGRPVARGAVRAGTALAFGAALATAGPALLAALVGVRPALLALAAVVLYTLVYTPLKTRSPFCTLAGAVVGSIPPLIGWAAAAGSLAAGGWILAALLFAWQIPHFLSLAWLHRDEYAAAGYKMLPSVDPGGRFRRAPCALDRPRGAWKDGALSPQQARKVCDSRSSTATI
jgi:protoheme IX farnesyltransferase